MDDFIGKAEVLMEALPYFQRFYGKTFVVKYAATPWRTRNSKRASPKTSFC